MRVTKYVRADGENWQMLKIRCSAHVSYDRLDKALLQAGWVHWSGKIKSYFDKMRKKVAASNPVKFPNWKQVQIEFGKPNLQSLPKAIQEENEKKNLEIMEHAASFGVEDANEEPAISNTPKEESALNKFAATIKAREKKDG